MSDLKHEILEQYIAQSSRRRFLSIAGKAAGAGAMALTVAAQTTGSSTGSSTGTTVTGSSSTTGSDVGILNYALTLEFLEATFYTTFLGQGALPSGYTSFSGLVGSVTGSPSAFTATSLSGANTFSGLPSTFGSNLFALLTQIRDHETTHVATLIAAIKALGGTPTEPCTYTFPVTDINSFLTTAQALENTGVSAYDGAINL